MKQYEVGVFNTEFPYARSNRGAKRVIRKELRDGQLYTRMFLYGNDEMVALWEMTSHNLGEKQPSTYVRHPWGFRRWLRWRISRTRMLLGQYTLPHLKLDRYKVGMVATVTIAPSAEEFDNNDFQDVIQDAVDALPLSEWEIYSERWGD